MTNLLRAVAATVRLCFADGIPRRSFAVALVVGTILNLINQADALFGAHPFSATKAALTYLVPYCVATYGAVSYVLKARRRHPMPPASVSHPGGGDRNI